jgi:hypothetical protein
MVCRPAAAPEWSRDRARRQESPAPQSRSHAPIQSEVQSCLGQEESDEDQCIDDRCSNVRGARLIRASEALGGRPNDDRQQDPREVTQVGKDAQDQRNGQRGLADRNRVGEEPRIHADEMVPEVDPSFVWAYGQMWTCRERWSSRASRTSPQLLGVSLANSIRTFHPFLVPLPMHAGSGASEFHWDRPLG